MTLAAPVVNDVTGLNPVPVMAIVRPITVVQVQEAITKTTLPISVGGGHFSMGGQTASAGTLHLDMRAMNRILEFSPSDRTIRVEAGVRWCDIQRFIDPHGLAVKIMQTYANFTVGGSLSVNVHGRYVGLGPLILSVRSIVLVLADGSCTEASPWANSRLFYAAIGGYGAIGVIVEATLELTENKRVARSDTTMPVAQYLDFFRRQVRSSSAAVFHNADIYPPHYRRVRAVTWSQTTRAATVPHRLQPHRRVYPLHRYFLWAFTETASGKWRREHIVDPLLHLFRPVHWRNYEAGYDVAELEPPSRKHRTYVLQEYFVPVERIDEFVPRMAEVLSRHRVNAVNVSIRHALGDPGTLLAWARGETFAFVLYHKQRTRDNARERVGVWTRELIDAALACGGTYYLPYQPHATRDQFERAYPRAGELFALKREIDPQYRFRNVLWDTYYDPAPQSGEAAGTLQRQGGGDFRRVYDDVRARDRFYLFLQNIYRLYPEDRFHALIRSETADAARCDEGDEQIYRRLQERLPTIRPLASQITYALPALARQKREMARQTLQLLGERRDIDGYVEIGGLGRYLGALRRRIRVRGDVVMVDASEQGYSPEHIAERGRIGKVGRHVPLSDYAPIGAEAVADASVDLVTCYIGLHHVQPSRLQPFLESLARMLRPGGLLIVRDHDVRTPQMFAFVSLAHTVFNAGLGLPWESNRDEPRHFASVQAWVQRLTQVGLHDRGARLVQAHDPTDNVLLAFEKPLGELG